MKFSRLRIAGFKTFVDSTDFLIEPGLTAIVGPNGCGKSNLVEALRWVMGESSHKSLRASGMDDMIFSGSGSRPARNTAEVVITLDNSDRLAPSQFNDTDTLEISRRIEREAGSSYRINGRDVRARDVQLLFADASTGARSPSMVRQGQIGELIAAKPKARRKILEEAAGIAGLHTRRHEAELRLRGAEQNLERLNDVLAEIESRLEALKKQARQAQRYRQMSTEIRRIDAILMHLRWREAAARIGERETALQAIAAKVADETGAVAALETRKNEAIDALPALRDEEVRAAAALRHLMVTRDGLDSERQRIVNRQGELSARIEQAAGDSARERRSIANVGETLGGLQQEADTLAAAIASATTHAEALQGSFADAESNLQTSETQLGVLTREQAERAAKRGQIERNIRDEAQRIARLEAQLKSTREELSALTSANDGDGKIAELEQATEAARGALEQADATHAATLQAQEQMRASEGESREPLRRAEADLSALQAEQKAIANMVTSSGDLWPAVIEQVAAAQGFETALGAAIGDDLDHPADRAAPIYWRQDQHIQDDDPALPAGAEPLSAHVRAPAFLARRLSQIGVVADRAAGEALQAALRPGQRLVTREGDLWRWDGLVSADDAPSAAARRLEQRNRLAELDDLIATAQNTIEDLRGVVSGAALKVAAAGQAEAEARQARRGAQSQLDMAQRALSQAQKEAAQDTARLGALREAETRLDNALAESRGAESDAKSALASLADDSALERDIEQQRHYLANARASYAEARAARDGHANEIAGRKRRLEEVSRDTQRWQDQQKAAEDQIATLEKRASELKAELDGLAAAPAALDQQRAAMEEQISAAETTRKQAADVLAQAETAAAAIERDLKAAQMRAGEARELKAREEATIEGLRQRLADIGDHIAEALECDPADVLKVAGIDPNDIHPDTDRLETKLERLKNDRERLGGVNLRAEQEAREEQERFDALAGERADLEEAVARLRGAIQSLNREGRERLLAAFETVNGHFQQLFTKLFGGGAAELQFTESDDPLEAGLEILARPPGKRPSTLTLLSGGEQALTAIALIFAVFLTNPAPVCVLDEVDAPLDDANVERFCGLLEEMTKLTETRFMVITHNPITMARMNRLYGVTMAERGVSQLVAVDLMDAERLREAS